MRNPRYKSFLRTLYGAIISSRLSTSELKMLSDELRGGQLADELAFMIDRILEHLGGSSEDEFENDRVAEAERLVRRNKVSKAVLGSIMESFGLPPSSTNGSVREMIGRFMARASTSRIAKFMEILESQQATDGFLAGISETRK